MGTLLTADQLRAARGHALLLGRPPDSPGHRAGSAGGAVAGIAAHLGGLQAQAAPPARLAVRPRTTGLTAADADRACADRDVTRTWAMRGTLHLMATADVRWMTGLFGPVSARKDRRRRLRLGLGDELCERALTALASILTASPPLTRAELISGLAVAGIEIDPRTQQPPHLLGYAAARGLICRGPDRPGDEPSYALLDGAPLTDALADTPLAPRLLGHFDPLLMGYQDRTLILDPAHARSIQAGGGFIQPTVLAGGRGAGTWRLKRGPGRGRLVVEPFTALAAATRDALAAEAADVGRYLGIDVTFEVAPS